mgnify:CR=1 FL=1
MPLTACMLSWLCRLHNTGSTITGATAPHTTCYTDLVELLCSRHQCQRQPREWGHTLGPNQSAFIPYELQPLTFRGKVGCIAWHDTAHCSTAHSDISHHCLHSHHHDNSTPAWLLPCIALHAQALNRQDAGHMLLVPAKCSALWHQHPSYTTGTARGDPGTRFRLQQRTCLFHQHTQP